MVGITRRKVISVLVSGSHIEDTKKDLDPQETGFRPYQLDADLMVDPVASSDPMG